MSALIIHEAPFRSSINRPVALPASAPVRITEFMTGNTGTLADENGDFSDRIEI
jgi:hypothetical protein